MLKNITVPTLSLFKLLDSSMTNHKQSSGIYNFMQNVLPSNFKRYELSDLEAQRLSHMEIMNHSALVSTSDLKGNIIQANELFCVTSKYTLEELIGKPHSIVRHPDTPESVFKDMWSTIGKGKVWQGELQNLAKDGSVYWVLATIAPVMDKKGKPKKYISVRYDITLQKQIQEDLKEAKKR